MSWLRDWFHNFVFPAFVAAEKESSQIGEPFDVKASPHAPERLPSELRKMWTLCKEHEVPFEYDVREVNLYGGTSKYRERARVDHKVLNSTLDSAMAAMRAEGCDRLFLGGRDVWAFAVMCERRRIPYMFVPELSRTVSGRPEVRRFLEERGFTGRELFLDTGFAGSIPRSLQKHFPGTQFKFRLMSQTEQFVAKEAGLYDTIVPGKIREVKKDRWKRYPNQLFPNRKTAREEALFQEYVAKFWKTGTFSEPMRSAPIGQVNAVFKEWLHKPNVWRYDDAHKRTLCLTDGKDAVCVGLSDLKLQPGFHEWWRSLPKGPAWVPPDHKMGRIVQYLSDKRSIQRAALLTSQLWRGIPNWKGMTVEKPARVTVTQNVGNAVINTNGISSIQFASNSTATATSTYTIGGGDGVWIPGQPAPQSLAAAGMKMVKGKDDQNGLPTLEIVKSQMELFPDLPKAPDKPKLVEEPGGQMALPKEWTHPSEAMKEALEGPDMAAQDNAAKLYVFQNFATGVTV